MIWLKITFKEEDIVKVPSSTYDSIEIAAIRSDIAPIEPDRASFRMSPIFPLHNSVSEVSPYNKKIYFYQFRNPYKVLGRIQMQASEELKQKVFCSIGLASVMVIGPDTKLCKEFDGITNQKPYAKEVWTVGDSKITHIDSEVETKEHSVPSYATVDYSVLNTSERAVADEFYMTIALLLPKLSIYMPFEVTKIVKLVNEVNNLVGELIFLRTYENKPQTLNEYTVEDFHDPKLNHLIRHQNLDRIIQINSSLSYISTQGFSGAIPILERRSLIRRHSLLGIGSAVLGLNSIARFIESSFSKIDFETVVTNLMANGSALKGLENLADYDSSEWDLENIDNFDNIGNKDPTYFKLPYFSGRLGFRETQYSIAAAIQSITGGAGLEHSLMTLTHEMLHGHVRALMSYIFFGPEKKKPEVLQNLYYEKFQKQATHISQNLKLIDCVRNVILTHCCLTINHGSLTRIEKYSSDDFVVKIPKRAARVWEVLAEENRSISEIIVHVLDLHYFYASRVSVYIPLIWSSWISIPHIRGDFRQYILRSLLAVASKEQGDPFQRFNASVSRLIDILNLQRKKRLDSSITTSVLEILADQETLKVEYFGAFKASLIVVDLVTKVFVSQKVRASILNDDFVSWVDNDENEENFEKEFSYVLQAGFNDENVRSPVCLLLDRIITELNSEANDDTLEKRTTEIFLAINSNSNVL